MNSEPALSIGGVSAVVNAGIALLVTYGFEISDEQQGAIIAFAAALAGLLSAILIRMHVFAPTSVEKITAAGRVEAPTSTETLKGTAVG